MKTTAPRLVAAIAAGTLLSSCSAPGPAPAGGGGGGAPTPVAATISKAARATLDRVLAARLRPAADDLGAGATSPAIEVLGPAVATGAERVGGELSPVLPPAPRGARATRVRLPATGRGAFRIEDVASRVAVGVRAISLGGRPAPEDAAEVVDGYVVYASPRGDVEVVHRPTHDGTEDFVRFERAPREAAIEYEIAPGDDVAGLRLVAGTLELLDAAGAPRLRMAAPYVVDAAGARHDATVEVRGCAVDTDPRAPFGRPPTPPRAARCALRVAWGAVAYPAVVDPAWTTTGSMASVRESHAAARLADGKVLVCGGQANGTALATAEVYSPVAKAFAATGSMGALRYRHTATTLTTGRVLVTGSAAADPGGVELYDPATGKWAALLAMKSPRQSHTATLLANDAVLLAGGWATTSVELYSVANNSGSTVYLPSLKVARAYHTATLLASGKVLAVGGTPSNGPVHASAEVWDPVGAQWTLVGSMGASRREQLAVLLPDEKVLVAGGNDGVSDRATAEIFDPATGQFTATASMVYAKGRPTGGLYKNKVVVASQIAELFDPASATWTRVGNLKTTHDLGTTTWLASEKLLVTGGRTVSNTIGSAELFDLAPLGDTCSFAGECASGFCVDGVCCDTACGAGCDVCEVSLGAAKNGTCGPAKSTYESNGCSAFRCDGAGITCPTSCASDANCKQTHYCDASGTCVAKKKDGLACDPTVGADCKAAGCKPCTSGNCVDGVCCDAPCSGKCDACALALGASKDGACTILPAGANGSPACTAPYLCSGTTSACTAANQCTTDAQCSPTHYCGAAGACTPRKATASACDTGAGKDCKEAGCRACQTGHCVDGFCCDAACDGACDTCAAALGASANGACTLLAAGEQGTPACASPYLCNGKAAACPDACTADVDCVAGRYCAPDATCKPKKAVGALCNPAAGGDCMQGGCAVCASGSCADGVCCGGACAGPCDVCSKALGAPQDGTCANAPDGYAGSPACGAYLCAGDAATCPATCATDADCVKTAFCQASDKTCQPRLVDGAACKSGLQCQSGFCVDGVCCNTACGGTCVACTAALKGFGADGVCDAAKIGTDPHGQCPDQGAASCGYDGTCNGQGACRMYAPGTSCGASQCQNGAVTGQVCNGQGACAFSAGGQPCAPYLCVVDHCTSTCAKNADCTGGTICFAGACVPKFDPGAACAGPGECKSGHCVDGVCCDTACDGLCRACTKALKGGVGADGVCGFAATGMDPHGDCPDEGAASCKFDGACNGSGACRLYTAGTACAAGICSGTTAKPKECNGFGACVVGGDWKECAPFGCADGACKVACAADADCAGGSFCDAGACAPKLEPGAACAKPSQCASGFCTDGVCCNLACNGVCEACTKALKGGGADGACGKAAIATDPHDDCQDTGAGSCGSDGTCDGNGACRVYAAGTECGASECSAGAVKLKVCNGLGKCTVDANATPCSPYACVAGACLASCAGDGDCVDATHCAAGACVPKRDLGEPCLAKAECLSGWCVDGVCCNTLCNGLCQACAKELKEVGSDGICDNAKDGADPHDECSADGEETCDRDGACDGKGACRLWAAGTDCGAATCDGTRAKAARCDGFGECLPDANGVECAPFACADGACKETCATAADCAKGSTCEAGACVPAKGLGAACAAGGDCASGHCVDGVCCAEACSGQCQACDGPKKGTCAPVKGAPRGGRAACLGGACGGACDGVDGAACAYPGASTGCGSACAEGSETPSVCDGHGACVEQPARSCAPYVCDGATACRSACDANADCATGFACLADRTCAPTSATCLDDRTLVDVDGKQADCGHYRCVVDHCATECTSVDDCVAPFVCDPAVKQCVAATDATASNVSGACATRAPGAGGAAAWTLGLAALGLAAARRRRRPGSTRGEEVRS